MSVGQGLLALLGVISALLAYIAVKATRAFGRLTEARIRLYTEHLTHLHEIAHALNHGEDLPERAPGADKAIDVIASFAVMRASTEAYEAVLAYHHARSEGQGAARIEAAKQALEAKLVELNVKMRDDLKLNAGAGQIPNAEVFRAKRGA
ncbi:hypothetical protein FIU86_18520 [Roseovarius sp. THAF9]|uniref:hypothetical protein n=1 Tax=Roseovarius sp. THAF9 TaxID=2587847 RepID=UPI0012692C86|nr:hypothetical protein [Roseovarius sp. THAF9]QFT94851.1 hypothetical protein FIU86_18520 [Roseovarius sp. THAF9]